MIIAQSEFLILSYIAESETVKVDWQVATESMTPEDFKEQIILESEAFKKYKPKNVLGCSQNLFYSFRPKSKSGTIALLCLIGLILV